MSVRSLIGHVGGSRSTDKLLTLAAVAEAALCADPQLTSKLKSLEITWAERAGELLPSVKIEFKDQTPPRGGTIG